MSCFHSLQENLKRKAIQADVDDAYKFPFLTGKFEAGTDGSVGLARMVFPFLTGKFEAVFQGNRRNRKNKFPFLTGKFEARMTKSCRNSSSAVSIPYRKI